MDRPEQNELYAKIQVEELLAAEAENEQSSIEELSAAELLDLLDQDVKQVHQFEERDLQGIETLLEAIAAQKHNPIEDRLDRLVAHTLRFRSEDSLQPETMQPETMEIEKKAANLAMVAQRLQQQVAEVSLREMECDQVTIDLLEAQQKLLSELDTVLERLDDHDLGDSSPPLRRVA